MRPPSVPAPWVRQAADFPRACSHTEYEAAIGEYLRPLAGRGEIAGIYQFGSIGTPGISDIDLIVVLEDDVHSFSAELLGLERLTPMAQYLFMHRPFVMSRSACPGIRLFYDVHRMTIRQGKEAPDTLIGTGAPEGHLQADVQMAMLVDFGLELLRQFVQIQVTGRLRIRPLLCLLLSAQTSIHLAHGLGLVDPERGRAFGEEIRSLRSEAVGIPPDILVAEVGRLVERAAALLNASLFRAGERMSTGVLPGGLLEFAPKDLVVFTSKLSSEQALALSLSDSHDTDRRWSWKRIRNRMILFQSAGLAGHFACYAASGGAVGRAVAARLTGARKRDTLSPSYAAMLTAKARFADRQADFLARLGLSFGQMFLYTLGPSNMPPESSWLSELLESWTRRVYLSYAE